MTGRIDVHSHILPDVDDGCLNVEDSLACARMLVKAGYTHSFCTPHIWPSLPRNTVAQIPIWTSALQGELDRAGVPLKLIPGGELNFRPDMSAVTATQDLVTYGMARQFLLIDIWVDKLPAYFTSAVKWLQSLGPRVILAHPERMRAVQDDDSLIDTLADMRMLFQGNLQCLADPPGSATRRTMERLLLEDRYFLFGTDCHNSKSLPIRLEGLNRAIDLVGAEVVDRLTIENPRKLLPATI